jgi:pyrimidine operon attenuation protein/uracil phosphoribosyltransferase
MSMFELNSYKKDAIDHDKLSRQIRTYGIKITKILSKLKILIVGLKGYEVEIANKLEENLEKIEKLKSELIHLHSEEFDKENIEMIHE